MNSFKNISIKNKLIIIIVSTSIGALVAGLTTYLVFDMINVRVEMKKNAILNANLVGQYAAAPLLFGYKEEATEILAKLNTIPSVLDACLYSSNSGEIFATYHKVLDNSFKFPLLHNDSCLFSNGFLHVFYTINYNEQYCGTIYMRISASTIHEKFVNNILVIVALVLLILVAVYIIAYRLQKVISAPILNLAELTAKISQNHDFTVQLDPQGTDEVGILYQQFNKLLSELLKSQTERDLADKEIKFLAHVLKNVNECVSITDINETIIFVNQSLLKTYGYKENELIGQNITILRSSNTPPEIIDLIKPSTLEGGWHGELFNRRKDGSEFPISLTTTIIFDKENKPIALVGVSSDITERKKAEQEIRDLNTNLEQRIKERTEELAEANEELMQEIEERTAIEEALILKSNELENFFRVALDLLCIADTSGKFIKVNKAWESILGYSTEDLENRQFLDFVHPDDIQATIEAMSQLSEQNPIFDFTNRYRTNDGNYRYIEWHSVPVGNLIYAAARDVTERKRAENFEFELLQLSSKMTGITTDEITGAINIALERIGQFLNTDRIYIIEFNWDTNTMNNTFEWCKEGIPSEIDNLQNFPLDTIPEWMAAIKNQDVVNIPSVVHLPEKWNAERNIFNQQGVRSLVAIPMFSEKNLIGFVGLDAITKKRAYNSREINILKVWSRMLSSLINKEKTEKLLEQTRKNYEIFFNTLNDFLWVLDNNGNIIHSNNIALKRLEYSLDELVGKSILMIHPLEQQTEAKLLLSKLLSGSDEVFSISLMSKSGIIIPVETHAIRGFWNGQSVIFKVSKDISKIKLSEQKFSTAFQSNSAMMAISYFDDGTYVDVNNAFLDILGFSRDEIIGKTNKELELFAEANLRNEILDSLNKDKPIRKIEILMRTKDGAVKTGLLSADSITLGTRKCLLTVTLDISDRKKAEEALKIAQQEAERANVAKSEFLSRMSHELRTPMNSILGFAQLLEMSELNPGQKKGVNHIMHSGKHLLDLINEVLDISRIEAGRLSLSPEPVQISNIIQEMIDIVKPLANGRQLTLELIDSPTNNLFIKSDRQRLKQVLLNLINNAIKYNREGGSITIKSETMPKNKEGIIPIRISITDTGLGISQENISNLFKPFERAGAERTATEGTGLGLAVVKKLVDVMGGSLGVDSVLNEGSTFWIELPHIESQLETVEKTGNLVGFETKLTDKIGTILYIEDNISNIELVEQIISKQQSSIQLVTSMYGKDAIRLAIEHKPDLILLDLNLPDIHGSEVLDQVLRNSKTKEIPVVVISADAMPSQLEKLLNAGAKKYLTKPLDVKELLKIISEFVNK